VDVERTPEETELAAECHPAKNSVFLNEEVFFLDRYPLMGDPKTSR
jgi:hypothetical protein